MSDKMALLPHFIRNMITEPNFNSPDLGNLSKEDPKSIVNSIKTKTVLDLLNPIELHDPDPIISAKPIILVFCQPSEELVIERDKTYPYAPVSYATWLEAAGARCIPLPYNTNEGSI